MSEMVERLAAELQRGVCKNCRKPCIGDGGGITDCDCPRPEWDNPTPAEQARAVIVAMRDPTSAMCTAFWNTLDENSKPTEVWSAMIDEALKG